VLQGHFNQQFPVPTGTTRRDLRLLEMLVELINTGLATWLYRGINANIRADRLEAMLAQRDIREKQGAILVQMEHLGFDFNGNVFTLGPVQIHGPRMRLDNLAELEAAVGTGTDPNTRDLTGSLEARFVRNID
jgi:hypothetical protein